MKKLSLVVISLAWLLVSAPITSAAVFTPETPGFNTDKDGAWEFPAAVNTIFLGTEAAQDWLTIDFADGWPENSQTIGETAIESDIQDIFLRLNQLAAAQYLVHNRFSWTFDLPEPQHIWLRLEYRLWSQETEPGFDDPAMMIYHGNILIDREQLFEHCPEIARVETVCPWRTKRLYLGSLNGSQTLTFMAGEMGDLQKPTGVDIRALKLETQSVSISLTPTPIITPANTPTPTLIATSQTVVPVPTSAISYVNYNQPEKGTVLGASDDKAAEQIKSPTFQPWFLGLLSVGLLGIGLTGWWIYRRRLL